MRDNMKKIFLPALLACFSITACAAPKHGPRLQQTRQVETSQYATDTLRSEFEVTERVLRILEKAADDLETDKAVSKESLYEIVEILHVYSHKRHQEKEDKILFPFMKDTRGGEKKDFMGQLLMEHVSARDKLRNVSEAINSVHQGTKARKRISKYARAYIKHVRKHREAEEKILFPWINKVLTRDDQAALQKSFEEKERDENASGLMEKYTAMIENSEKQFGLYSE